MYLEEGGNMNWELNMSTFDTNNSSKTERRKGLRTEKITVLEKGIESVRYVGTPLPRHFSIKDRIRFYLDN